MTTKMAKRTRSHQSWLVESLADPDRAAVYLTTALEDSPAMFLEALRDVAQAREMSKVAREAGVTRKALYNITSLEGNPRWKNICKVLDALGIGLDLKPKSRGQEPPIPPATAPHSHHRRYARGATRAQLVDKRQLALNFQANELASQQVDGMLSCTTQTSGSNFMLNTATTALKNNFVVQPNAVHNGTIFDYSNPFQSSFHEENSHLIAQLLARDYARQRAAANA